MDPKLAAALEKLEAAAKRADVDIRKTGPGPPYAPTSGYEAPPGWAAKGHRAQLGSAHEDFPIWLVPAGAGVPGRVASRTEPASYLGSGYGFLWFIDGREVAAVTGDAIAAELELSRTEIGR